MKTEELERLRQLIGKFKEDMAVRNFSGNTVAVYMRYLVYFERYLAGSDVEEMAQIGQVTIRKYQMHLYNYKRANGDGLSMYSQSHALTVIRSFFRYLARSGYCMYDPAGGIELPIIKKRLPKNIMTIKEIRKVLNQPSADTLLGLRDKAMLEVLYSTGIRNSELRNLKIADIDSKNEELRVVEGKGGEDRVVPIGEVACAYVKEYLERARPHLFNRRKSSEETSTLFLSHTGKKILSYGLNEIIKKHIQSAGLSKHVTAHSFRHTCATHMMQQGAGLRYIQEMLGHKVIATTQLYTRVEISDLKKAHRRYHPREQTRQ